MSVGYYQVEVYQYDGVHIPMYMTRRGCLSILGVREYSVGATYGNLFWWQATRHP